MRILIACEESGIVRRAFRGRGYDAWSNDLVYDAADDSPHHLKGDCKAAIKSESWDLIIMHPPCDFLAVSGNRWYGRGTGGHQKRIDAVAWTLDLWQLATSVCDYVAMENPVGVIPLDATQYIQPWQFGHPETKKTGFWLHGLLPLKPTNVVPPPYENRVWKMGPGPDRKRLRSRTYLGVADAMADQWGGFVRQQHGVDWLGDSNYHVHKEVYGKC